MIAAIDQSMQEFIAENWKYGQDAVADSLIRTYRASSIDQAREMIAGFIAQQSSESRPAAPAATDEQTIVVAESIPAIATSPATPIEDESDPTALTETEVIEIVQRWNEDNLSGELSNPWTFEEMVDELKGINDARALDGLPSAPDDLVDRFPELVKQYAPNAPHEKPQSKPVSGVNGGDGDARTETSNLSHDELVKLGAREDSKFKMWFINRCLGCGTFGKEKCCGKVSEVAMVRADGSLTTYGRQATGLDPIKPPKPPKTHEQLTESWKQSPWWSSFSGVDEMESGGIKMYVENIIPEGVTIISGLAKEGKTWLALSITKALTSGQALFGKAGFEVPEPVPVIYLAAEVGDRAFKQRVQKFGITNDKSKFMTRTLTKGNMNLEDEYLLQAIRALQPVVILDVLSCFSQSEDEDDSVENQKLRRMIGGLRKAGARAVIILHHSTKDFKARPTKEHAIRGSGDILAMVDAVWALMLDDRLCQSTNVEEVDVIGWGRDFTPSPFRFALTRKNPSDRNGVASVIDTTGDLGWVDKAAARQAVQTANQDVADALERMVQEDPVATVAQLAKRTGQTRWATNTILKQRGWSKPSGRAKKGQIHQWAKATRSTGIQLN